ncbi:MAG: hypothetical protein J1F65_04600 [Clostridiales bacterium]|nr:hypothetical protein [Clostridiales bacterium]
MKKAKLIVALLLVFMMSMTVVLGACEEPHVHEFSQEWTSNGTYHWHKATCEHTSEVSGRGAHNWNGNVCSVCGRDSSLDSYRSYITADLRDVKDAIGDSISSAVATAVNAAYDAGVEAIQSGNTVTAIQSAFKSAKSAMLHCVPLANGEFDFTGLSQNEKTEILGLLEAYAIRTGMTGVSVYENGGYVMYHDRVVLGTENYIPGYGFGLLTEGYLKSELEYEQNSAWKMYYHTVNSQDPGNLNTLDDNGSETSDFYSYIGAGYFTAFMNSTKDGYDWVPELAKADPTPVGELNASGQTNTWEFPIRTGSELKYNTLGKRSEKYNDREVKPEDYITPFKLLLNQSNDYFRGSEMSKATGASAIPGASVYYNSTKGARKGILSEEEQKFEDVVGIKVYEKEPGSGQWWFQYTLGANVTAWYARYYISSSLYMPIPAEFVEEVGVDAYLSNSSDGQYNPVDNSLSLGSYTLERWDTDQQVVYKKNPNYVYADTKYQIAGVHINILRAALEDPNAVFNEFLAGHIDGAGIPTAFLKEYASDPRTRNTTGNNVTKLNFNALNAEDWEYFFGESGVVAQNNLSDYWQVEPALSNAHFRSALSYAINRNEWAANNGRIASVNFFSSNYQSDPENGIAYNLTEAHKKAVAPLLTDTDSGGYSLQLAREYFNMALLELEAAGLYTRGTPSNPTKIQIQIDWQAESMLENYHKPIKQYWEDAFNDDSVTFGGCYELEITYRVPNVWSEVYDWMSAGTFDVGIGSITGSSDDPLGYMEVLSTDQALSGGFTLNWAVDTNDPFADALVYNGMLWSYDALLESTQQNTIVTEGRRISQVTVTTQKKVIDEEAETVTLTFTISYIAGVTLDLENIDFVVYGYNDADNYTDYVEASILWDEDYENFSEYLVGGAPVINAAARTVTFTFTIPLADLADFPKDNFAVDVYLGWTFNGVTVPTGYYLSFYSHFLTDAE